MKIVGFAWFLQGIGLLPGSFMTGQIRSGTGRLTCPLLVVARRRGRPK